MTRNEQSHDQPTNSTDQFTATEENANARGTAWLDSIVPTEVEVGDPYYKVTGMDFIIHNMYADPTDKAFVTFRKWFSEDADAMLKRVASHVEQGLYRIISMQLSKHSCVLVVASEKAHDEFPEYAFVG